MVCRHFVASAVYAAGWDVNRGICDCHNPLSIKGKCSKEDSNLHRFLY